MTARRGKLVAGVAAIVGICTMGAGCQSASLPFHAQGGPVLQAAARRAPAGPGRQASSLSDSSQDIRLASATSLQIGPRARVGWEVEAADLKPVGKMAGTSYVGPDGTIQIGPYGALAVAGLTSDEARSLMEKHLAQYLNDPRVRIVVSPTVLSAKPEYVSSAKEAAWHPARHPAPAEQLAAASGMWRPARQVAAQKADEVVAASLQTASPGPELRLPAGTLDLHPAAAERDNPPAEAIPTAPAPIEVQGPVVDRPHVMVGHHGHVPPVAVGLDVPREMNKQALPRYIIEPPDILLVESTVFLKADQPIRGQHLVRPDGTIGLGIYGDVYVAGMTLQQAREAVFALLKGGRLPGLKSVDQISVDVLAYNSKWYYVITDGGGYGEQVVRLPITGNETVLDAISQINGLAPVSDKKRIWVARRNPGHGAEHVMPVDWIGISQHGATATNYQLMPGDRLYVKADKWRTFDARLQKVLAPIERALGVTLLGSETVSSVRGRGLTGATR